jgi:hypothetical protein
MKIRYSPLPLVGEGKGEGGPLSFPLTSIPSPEGRGRLKGTIFYKNSKSSYAMRDALCGFWGVER